MSLARQQPNRIVVSEHWFFIVWLVVSVWLLACAFLVGADYGDGYLTIVNARYFFGDSTEYYVQRGPLAALALWPVETIAQSLNLHPFDVRPYHFYSGILHSAYLVGCWLLLKRSGQPFVARIIAFAAAILSVVFFAYAPYLSHDIIPGFLFLALIFLCNRWIHHPAAGTALLLILLGTAVTFIKQTYAIFWVVLCVYAGLAFLFKWNDRQVSARKMLMVFALAGLSGLLSWIGYGWFTAGIITEVSLLERPLILINSVSAQYQIEAEVSSLFPWDLYFRNLHNYGIVAFLLVIPGLVLAFRGTDTRLRMIAVCWLISIIFMQSVSFKEVRYLGFLAPLTAMLIVPVVSIALKSRALFPALLAVFFVDQYRGLAMGAEQLSSTPGMSITRFVGKIPDNKRIVSSKILSFAFMPGGPILRDRYHGIFHITSDLLYRLNEGNVSVGQLEDARDLGIIGMEPGDRVFYSNVTITRKPPWGDGNVPSMLKDLVMTSGDAAMVNLRRMDDQFKIQGHDGKYLLLVPLPESGKVMPVLAIGGLSVTQVKKIYGDDVGDDLQVLAVVVDTLCQADRCRGQIPP